MIVSAREGKRISKSELAFRNTLWPDAEKLIWQRVEAKGFATIPKTMPLVHRIMDEMANASVSPTYHSVWCLTWDNGFARLNRPGEMAYAAGFTGQRGERTWRERLKALEALGFLLLKPNGNDKLGLALVPNPHEVIMRHRDAKTPGLRDTTFHAFLARASDMGCRDVMQMVQDREAAARAREAETSPNSQPAERAVRRHRPAQTK